MKISSVQTLTIIAAAVLSTSQSGQAQGALTPSAGPAPSMRTLIQVEPRTPVDSLHTPGDANSLFRITTPGSYYLTANVSLTSRTGDLTKQSGIEIQANDVTLDLNGFRVSNGAGTNGLHGVIVNGAYQGISIKNGSVTGWTLDGVSAVSVSASSFDNLSLNDNGDDGLVVGSTSTISNCRVTGNKNRGIVANADCTISDCTAQGNPEAGIVANNRCVISRCTVASVSSGDGIVADNFCTVQNCSVTGAFNFGIRTTNRPLISHCNVIDCGHVDVNGVSGGILLHYAGTVRQCAISFNRVGIEILGSSDGGGALVENNQIDSNTGGGIDLLSGGNRIDNNTLCCNGGPAIRSHERGNFIIRNHATSNNGGSPDYVFGANDTVGPIVSGKGVISGLANGSSPWANFQQ